MSDDILGKLFSLEGQTAVVTGASSGLGLRFAETLHAVGANVVALARREDRLEAAFGGREGFLPVRCDVTVAADREAAFRRTMEEYGSVDVLVNNAGTSSGGPAGRSVEEFTRIIEVDLIALYAMTLLASEQMRIQQRGSIVNIASVFGLVAGAPYDDSSYCAAKGGVVNLTRQVGAQWARRGIRVNALAPGFFMSELNEATLATEESAKVIREQCPIGRLGEYEELDAALLFLAGPGSTYMTGQILVVDGGWTAR